MCRQSATPEMTLEPLDNLPVIRDIMVDWKYCEERLFSLRLFLERIKAPAREPENIEPEPQVVEPETEVIIEPEPISDPEPEDVI